tara:strand:+ start:1787 stop:2515 length:729 start_codon:yes stop_codon:yes gene_type:complete
VLSTNDKKHALRDIDVVILAGGLGTRIRSVLGETPKVLAPINDQPYIDHLLNWLDLNGASKIILSLGYLGEKVAVHVAGRSNVECIIEPKPQGTGGGLRFCRSLAKSDHVFVMNGDTWLETDLNAFVQAHKISKKEVSMICLPVRNISQYGRVIIEKDVVVNFAEKSRGSYGSGNINAGIYLFSQRALSLLCSSNARSLETDFFSNLEKGYIHAYTPDNSKFIDFGTPENLAVAGAIFPKKK